MIEIKGKYNSAHVYADIIDEETIQQIYELLNQEFCKDSIIRIMPDCHNGKGCVIGTTMTIKDKVVPGLVGVDIGCGMLVVELGNIDIDFEKTDNFIRENEKKGIGYSKEVDRFIKFDKLKCYSHLKDIPYIYETFGTIGGGNHFVEIDRDEDNNYYLIIHSGSRNLGSQVAIFYQKQAIAYQKNKKFNKEEEKKKVIEIYKKSGKQKELEKKLKEIDSKIISISMPTEFCYLEGSLLDDYLNDMDICQSFAAKNREAVAREICKVLNLQYSQLKSFETIHNYINMDDKILRKGAIAAYKNQTVLIPINMKEGCIIGRGKSCEEYNYSAPHGAGRLMSRSMAKVQISMDDYVKSMEGIYTTSVCVGTIDESPFAYKPKESIIENIKSTIDIIKIIKPVYNFKRGN